MAAISQPLAKRPLRPCLSPTRTSRSPSPTAESSLSYLSASRSPSVCSTSSSTSCYLGPDGVVMKRIKSVQWAGAEPSYHDTWSATEYDRTPLAPPSESERACIFPARGSRCFSARDECEELDEEPEVLAPEPAGTPVADDHAGEPEWDECDRRRMMFARMCPAALDVGSAQPQFEGYRSMSATLAELLRQIGGDNADGPATPLVRRRDDEELSDVDECEATYTAGDDTEDEGDGPLGGTDRGRPMLFRLRGSSADSTATDSTDADAELGTPSLIWSAGSEVDSLVASPERRSSTVDMAHPELELGADAAKLDAHERETSFVGVVYHEHALSLF